MATQRSQRRPEFSFPGSLARAAERALPPRPVTNRMAPGAGEEEIRWLQASRQGSPDYASGTPSPQMWARHDGNHHRPYPASAGSSPSRAQQIAGYRREMLDLVRGLPESAYELSLRDIVERPSSPSPAPLPPPPLPPSNAAAATRENDDPAGATTRGAAAAGTADEQAAAARQGKKQGRKQRTMRKQRSRSMERSVSLDTGLLIKLFMPLSVGGKKKVSPKPDAGKDGKRNKKQGKKKEEGRHEEEWWTRSESSEAASSSRTSSTGSSNSSSSVRNGSGSSNPRAPVRNRSRKRTGCYAFFRANKSKNGVSQD